MEKLSAGAVPAPADGNSIGRLEASKTDEAMATEDQRMLKAAPSQTFGVEGETWLREVKFQREAVGRLEAAQLKLSESILKALRKSDGENQDIDTDLDYIDSWPNVEVTVIINELSRFDFTSLTFDVDCTVHFDWTDKQMKRDTHYHYNPESGNFEFASSLRSCKNDRQFFNPTLSIVNGSKLDIRGGSALPLIHNEIRDNGNDRPWLTKQFHVLGLIECRQVSALMFPFDVQGLKIRIAIPDMSGTTSLGDLRKIKLVEPRLRKELIQTEITKSLMREQPIPYVLADNPDLPMSHRWKVGDDGTSTLDVGEMQTLAYGGVSQPDKHEYCVYIILRRRWYPRYVFDILIMNLEVMVACMSVYVPFSPDMLTNRLAISLTILLTIVAGLANRPAAIESVSYSSAFDIYGQVMLLFVIIIALGNLAVFFNCWGSFRTAGKDDFYDEELRMVVNNAVDNFESAFWCQPGEYWSFGASKMDGVILWLSTIGQLIALAGTLVRAQMVRYSAVLLVKHELDGGGADLEGEATHFFEPGAMGIAYDNYGIVKDVSVDGPALKKGIRKGDQIVKVGTKQYSKHAVVEAEKSGSDYEVTFQVGGGYSRLVFCTDKFHFMSRYDLAGCAYRAKLLPFPAKFFWRIWSCARRCRNRTYGRLDMFPRNFNAMDAEDLLKEADAKMKSKATKLPSISKFNVKLSPADTFRIMDVGSGEMGFYSYWLDESDRVKSAGTDGKLKYQKGCTFVDQFITSGADGVAMLSQEIRQRFELDQLSHVSSRITSQSGDMSDTGGVRRPLQQQLSQLSGLPGVVEGDVSLFSSQVETPDANGRPKSREPKKRKLMMCLTGANRQMLRDDGPGRKQFDDFVSKVNKEIEDFRAECILFSPEDTDEAMYELWATEWVVQHGDLNISSLELGKTDKTLQGGRLDGMTTWHEVRQTFSDLKAECDLEAAYCEAAGASASGATMPKSVRTANFYECFNAHPELLRALLRSRSFSGTISAGSGSCQVAFRSTGDLNSSQVCSLPVGNRTPSTSMKITSGHEATLFNKKMPKTTAAAQSLLLGSHSNSRKSLSTCHETAPAWSDDGPVSETKLNSWLTLVEALAEESELPTGKNGLFVGISAVYYAAKLAGCDSKILSRDDFLRHLEAKRDELISEGGTDGRGLANLTLVMGLVKAVLHRSARIVCKRNWKVDEIDFVATWSLGMYLKHSGAMKRTSGKRNFIRDDSAQFNELRRYQSQDNEVSSASVCSASVCSVRVDSASPPSERRRKGRDNPAIIPSLMS